MRVFLSREEGRTLNALVASALGDTAIYLLGATNEEGTKSKGSYLLHWHAIQWFKENGISWYDLGGINPERNPGVYHFKKGFSGTDVTQLGRFQQSGSWVSSAVVRTAESMSRLRSRGRKLAGA